MKNKILLAIVITCCNYLFTHAQQEPHYTQYMYNMGIVNPGYMIHSPNVIKIGNLYRTQWVGMDGAPKTANVFGQFGVSDRMELGINYVNDVIGSKVKISDNVFNVNLAYRVRLNENLNLSLGVRAGGNQLNLSFTDVNINNDPTLQNTNRTLFNLGAGLFLFGKKCYVGLSAPNFIYNSIADVEYHSHNHFYFIAGYVFDLNENLKFKPSTVIKEVVGAPLTYDFSTNLMVYNKFEIGASYRRQDAIATMVNFNITPHLRIGYAYDFNISPLNTYNSGSHEFILLYQFNLISSDKRYSSPRFY